MTGYTPGPWTVVPHDADPGAYVVKEVEAKHADRWDDREDRSNARLIAAAPDLLNAVLSMRAASSPAARRLARAWADDAVAKATGMRRGEALLRASTDGAGARRREATT